MLFTHINKSRDVDINILLQLDDRSLKSMSRVNKDIYLLSNSNIFWCHKIYKLIPGFPMLYVPNIYCGDKKKLYNELIDNNNNKSDIVINFALKHGCLDLLKWRTCNKIIPTIEDDIYTPCINGRLDILQWLIQFIDPIQYWLGFATSSGNTHIVKWIMDTFDIEPDVIFINTAAKEGYIDTLKYLACYNIFPNQSGIDMARENNKQEVLDMLATYNMY